VHNSGRNSGEPQSSIHAELDGFQKLRRNASILRESFVYIFQGLPSVKEEDIARGMLSVEVLCLIVLSLGPQ